MFAGVADTHAGLWYLFGDSRLYPSAKLIAISVITLAEIVYFVEKGQLRASAYGDLQEAPLTGGIMPCG